MRSYPSLSAKKERVQIASDLHPFSIPFSGSGVGRIFKRRTLDITNLRDSLHALKASPHYPLTPFPFHYLCRGADELRFGWRR